jgi:hypothetical protein
MFVVDGAGHGAERVRLPAVAVITDTHDLSVSINPVHQLPATAPKTKAPASCQGCYVGHSLTCPHGIS